MNKQIEGKIKKISIIGRVALSIECLKMYSQAIGVYKTKEIEFIEELLWEFVEGSEKIEDWFEKVRDVEPSTIIDSKERGEQEEHKTISLAKFEALYTFYQSIPKYLVDLIEDALYIGYANMYGDTGEYSQSSFNAIIRVLEILSEAGLKLPTLAKYEKSVYEEKHGWGNYRDRIFFE
jgi:hypothetical protein